MRSERELRAAVKRGITLLNAHTPFWRRVVKVREMKFEDPCRCVLGTIGSTQACATGSNWDRGRTALGLVDGLHQPSYYGFDGSMQGEGATLKRLWSQAIRTGKV